jgi:hypothetical protein
MQQALLFGTYFMASAIEQIANGFVRIKDRAALQRMREHRSKLLQEYRMRPEAGWFRSKILETSLQDDLAVLDAALARFPRSDDLI